MDKIIGIITNFYDSYNYGGCLQAYALTKAVNNLGFECEQISFVHNKPEELSTWEKFHKHKSNDNFCQFLKWLIGNGSKKLSKNVLVVVLGKSVKQCIKKREKDFFEFRIKLVPASSKVYDEDTICSCSNYDYYICGSDIVWAKEFGKFCNAYWLGFTNSKNKIAYAASPPLSNLTVEESEFVKEKLSDFKAISVREEINCEYIPKIIGRKSAKDKHLTAVLDPVFLLSSEHWTQISNKYKNNFNEYAFLYGLDLPEKYIKYCQKYCKKNSLKLVYVPHVYGLFNAHDFFLKCIKEYFGPEGFVSLIKNAKVVFTNSFHGAAFSLIFHKKFVVTKRCGNHPYGHGKNSRTYNLLKKFDSLQMYLDSDEINFKSFANTVNSIDLDYEKIDQIMSSERKKSMNFLKNALDIKD